VGESRFAMAENVPRETIYVNNINEKVNKEELKKSLYAVFTQFGPILDIVALKTHKMRGQAFVVFRDTSAATQAVRQMNGFPFYEKPMRIGYAKSKSDASSKLEGTYQPKDKAERQAKRKAEREALKEGKKAAPAGLKDSKQPPAQQSAAAAAPTDVAKPTDIPPPMASAPVANLPNQILFVENLPEAVNEMMLSMLFQQFGGFKEVRLVPGKTGIAFVEFDSEMQSGVAMSGLQNFKITPTNLMKITYAKR